MSIREALVSLEIFWPPDSDVSAKLVLDGVQNELTKSIVATSLAVVKCGMPAFGFGTLAMTSWPSSIDMRNALLNMPSRHFLMAMHRLALTESAATLASPSMSNLISRFRRFSASSTTKRPRVNLKNSSLEFQSDPDELHAAPRSKRRAYLTCLRSAHVLGRGTVMIG